MMTKCGVKLQGVTGNEICSLPNVGPNCTLSFKTMERNIYGALKPYVNKLPCFQASLPRILRGPQFTSALNIRRGCLAVAK